MKSFSSYEENLYTIILQFCLSVCDAAADYKKHFVLKLCF